MEHHVKSEIIDELETFFQNENQISFHGPSTSSHRTGDVNICCKQERADDFQCNVDLTTAGEICAAKKPDSTSKFSIPSSVRSECSENEFLFGLKAEFCATAVAISINDNFKSNSVISAKSDQAKCAIADGVDYGHRHLNDTVPIPSEKLTSRKEVSYKNIPELIESAQPQKNFHQQPILKVLPLTDLNAKKRVIDSQTKNMSGASDGGEKRLKNEAVCDISKQIVKSSVCDHAAKESVHQEARFDLCDITISCQPHQRITTTSQEENQFSHDIQSPLRLDTFTTSSEGQEKVTSEKEEEFLYGETPCTCTGSQNCQGILSSRDTVGAVPKDVMAFYSIEQPHEPADEDEFLYGSSGSPLHSITHRIAPSTDVKEESVIVVVVEKASVEAVGDQPFTNAKCENPEPAIVTITESPEKLSLGIFGSTTSLGEKKSDESGTKGDIQPFKLLETARIRVESRDSGSIRSHIGDGPSEVSTVDLDPQYVHREICAMRPSCEPSVGYSKAENALPATSEQGKTKRTFAILEKFLGDGNADLDSCLVSMKSMKTKSKTTSKLMGGTGHEGSAIIENTTSVDEEKLEEDVLIILDSRSRSTADEISRKTAVASRTTANTATDLLKKSSDSPLVEFSRVSVERTANSTLRQTGRTTCKPNIQDKIVKIQEGFRKELPKRHSNASENSRSRSEDSLSPHIHYSHNGKTSAEARRMKRRVPSNSPSLDSFSANRHRRRSSFDRRCRSRSRYSSRSQRSASRRRKRSEYCSECVRETVYYCRRGHVKRGRRTKSRNNPKRRPVHRRGDSSDSCRCTRSRRSKSHSTERRAKRRRDMKSPSSTRRDHPHYRKTRDRSRRHRSIESIAESIESAYSSSREGMRRHSHIRTANSARDKSKDRRQTEDDTVALVNSRGKAVTTKRTVRKPKIQSSSVSSLEANSSWSYEEKNVTQVKAGCGKNSNRLSEEVLRSLRGPTSTPVAAESGTVTAMLKKFLEENDLKMSDLLEELAATPQLQREPGAVVCVDPVGLEPTVRADVAVATTNTAVFQDYSLVPARAIPVLDPYSNFQPFACHQPYRRPPLLPVPGYGRGGVRQTFFPPCPQNFNCYGPAYCQQSYFNYCWNQYPEKP